MTDSERITDTDLAAALEIDEADVKCRASELLLARTLRVYRKRRGLTQADLASQVGCDAALISRYEAGSAAPPFRRLMTLAGVLGFAIEIRDVEPAPRPVTLVG